MNETVPKSMLKAHLYGLLLASAGLFFGMSYSMFNTFFDVFATRLHEITPKNFSSVSINLNFYYVLGCTFSCLVGSLLLEKMGRFRSLLVVMTMEIVVTSFGFLDSLPMLYLMRFLHGFAAFFWLILTPLMMKENLPPGLPKTYNPVFSAFLCTGMLLAFFFGRPALAPYWKFVLVWPFYVEIPRLMLFLILFPMESPQYLASRLKSTGEIAANYAVLYAPAQAQQLAHVVQRESGTGSAPQAGLREAFSPAYRKQIILCVVMNTVSTLSFNGLLNMYSTKIFKQLGNNSSNGGGKGILDDPANMTIIMGFWNVMSCLSMVGLLKLLDKRKLIIVGLLGIVASYIFFLYGMLLNNRMLVMMATNFYATSFTYSLGGVLYPYCVDIIPAPVLSLCAFLQWGLSALTILYSDYLLETFGNFWIFFFAQNVCFLSFVLFAGYSINTNNKTAEQIKLEFQQKKFLG